MPDISVEIVLVDNSPSTAILFVIACMLLGVAIWSLNEIWNEIWCYYRVALFNDTMDFGYNIASG